jgi:hypothetical protein
MSKQSLTKKNCNAARKCKEEQKAKAKNWQDLRTIRTFSIKIAHEDEPINQISK